MPRQHDGSDHHDHAGDDECRRPEAVGRSRAGAVRDRAALVHGQTMEKDTGRPRYAAASTRTRIVGSIGERALPRGARIGEASRGSTAGRLAGMRPPTTRPPRKRLPAGAPSGSVAIELGGHRLEADEPSSCVEHESSRIGQRERRIRRTRGRRRTGLRHQRSRARPVPELDRDRKAGRTARPALRARVRSSPSSFDSPATVAKP